MTTCNDYVGYLAPGERCENCGAPCAEHELSLDNKLRMEYEANRERITQAHPALLGIGSTLVLGGRELYERQQAALVKARQCGSVEGAIAAYLQHMRETEET